MNKCIVTTSWDDGHKLDVRLCKLLKKYNIKGTIYVSPRDHEWKKEDLLSDEEIKKISKDFEIGAHTMTHPVLTRIPLADAEQEIAKSKKYLENVTKKKIRSFCYPRGAYNKKLELITKNAGFRSARTVERYKNNVGNNLFAVPTTFHCYRHWSDLFSILKTSKGNLIKFWRFYTDWEPLAKHLFEESKKNGTVFHLWGHSWEIDKNNDWEKLERVLSYMSNDSAVRYWTNDQVIKATQ